MEILTVRDLTFTYPQCEKPILNHISFSIEEGDFIVICGATGSGKSTLLRMLKKELIPNGTQSGSVFFRGSDLNNLDNKTTAEKIGFVMQRPEQQIVSDKVWHELAFGLENLGTKTSIIRRRVAEMAAYFDIEDWFDRRCDELSGGQKQLLNLASIMVMQPEVLILDEPTSQLDPIAASDFLKTVKTLNLETGLTVVLVEHRLEEVVADADKLLLLENGSLKDYDHPHAVCSRMKNDDPMLEAMPTAVRLFRKIPQGNECPLNVREGRRWIRKHFTMGATLNVPAPPEQKDIALQVENLWFRYGKTMPDVLMGTTLTVNIGEIFTILGGNGSGKSTLMSCLAGIRKPYSGSISIFGKMIKEYRNQTLYRECLTMLPQDVQTLFLRSTVREELKDAAEILDDFPVDLTPLMDRHPYDLSGGEQQLVALARVLATRPRLLLLDEPTKGLDAHSRNRIAQVLMQLKKNGMTIICITHDAEFAAAISDHCALFFRGVTVSSDPPRRFFSENRFYTTAANRMTSGWFNNAVTLEDAELLCLESRNET